MNTPYENRTAPVISPLTAHELFPEALAVVVHADQLVDPGRGLVGIRIEGDQEDIVPVDPGMILHIVDDFGGIRTRYSDTSGQLFDVNLGLHRPPEVATFLGRVAGTLEGLDNFMPEVSVTPRPSDIQAQERSAKGPIRDAVRTFFAKMGLAHKATTASWRETLAYTPRHSVRPRSHRATRARPALA